MTIGIPYAQQQATSSHLLSYQQNADICSHGSRICATIKVRLTRLTCTALCVGISCGEETCSTSGALPGDLCAFCPLP